MLQNSRIALKKIPWQKSDGLAEQHGHLAKSVYKIRGNLDQHRATFFSLSEVWYLLTPSTIKPEQRQFVMDSGAPMHMLSVKDLNSGELDTLRVSRNPATVFTINGEEQTSEDTTVYVKYLDLFVTVQLLEDTLPVLPLGQLCKDHGYSCGWTRSQKPHLVTNGTKIQCYTESFVPIFVPGLSSVTSSFSTAPPSSASISWDPSRENSTHTQRPKRT